MSTHSTRGSGRAGTADRARMVCAAWLFAGFIGASTMAAGVLGLLEGEATFPHGLMLALCGGVAAATAWTRSRSALSRAERTKSIAGDSSAKQAGVR